MNEELIRQCAREAEEGTRGASVGEVREAAELAIRIYHARAVKSLLEALKPFALIAELDIGDDEVDSDLFRPLTRNHAPHITVGHLRAALAALAPFQQEADSPASDPEDYCEGCGNGDKVPASGYWRCPKCDAEWPGEA